jgi:NAD(P)-dependent dehydrogenase (short-subunit alcohol dehydrogenase family)
MVCAEVDNKPAPPVGERLDGRIAVITGAGRGFGEQIALELDALGAAVAVLDIDEASVRRAFTAVREQLGPVDILVNNAGIVSQTPFLELTEQAWDRVFQVDYTSMYLTCREVAAGMVDRRTGRIVNISSLAGKRGGGILGKTAYAGAKATVNGLTHALAREFAPAGVRIAME